MKRIVLALFVGAVLTLLAVAVLALILSHGGPGAIFGFALYAPLSAAEKLGLFDRCADADTITDKLGCIRNALLLAAIVYTLMFGIFSFASHKILARWPRRLSA